jgi:hypothetical protein
LQAQYTPNREASLLSQLLKEKFSGVPDTPTLANAANAAQSDTPLAMLKTLACLAGMTLPIDGTKSQVDRSFVTRD